MQTHDRSLDVTIKWLMGHDSPSVRYLTMRDLEDRPASDSRMSELLDDISEWSPVAGLLRAQNPAGYWRHSEDCYWPKWSATVWTLILLGELGIGRENPSVVAGSEYFLKVAAGQNKSWPPIDAETPEESYRLLWEPCVTGNMARTLSVFGYGRDPRVQLMFEFLLKTQLPDGGWNCEFGEWGTKVKHSSFMSTIEPLWAFSTLERSLWPTGAKEVVAKAAEFMLTHRLFKSDKTGKVINEEWTKLHFPLFYFYDILHGLRVLVDLGYGSDERMTDALQLLRSKQLNDGKWLMEGTYLNSISWNYLKDSTTGLWHDERHPNTAEIPDIYQQLGRVGEPNPWITLEALRVLKAIA